jgi:CheY-like chemotaxis protein
VIRAEDEVRWISERRKFYFDPPHDRPVRALLVALDVTERRRAERRKDEFLATLAHELRNPLAPVRIGLHLLAQPGLDESASARTRDMMGRQIGQLTHLIDDLLDVSRISTGKVILRRRPVQLRLVIESAIEACRPLIDAGRHQLTFEPGPDEIWVNGDMARLSQVVSNLLTNAAKYTPPGGRIEVELQKEKGDAIVRVTDSGVGIPADMTERVFEMFAQVNQTLDRAQGGLGIGLSLVRTLMDLHGGSVSATSKGLGRGSTFTLRLPAIVTPPRAAGAKSGNGPAERAREMRVLVIDDNRDGADSLALLLDLEGHRTHTEYTAVGGLNAALAFNPDVIFCDIGLPTLNGYEVARRVRQRTEATNVPYLVAITGWGTQEDKVRAREAGFDFHLTKPVAAEAVRELLAKLPVR